MLSQPREMSANDVAAAGKAQGLTLTAAYIYGIRSRADRSAARKAPASPVGRRPGRSANGGSGGDAEQTLVRAIIAVGTERARQVLEHVEREVSRISAPRG